MRKGVARIVPIMVIVVSLVFMFYIPSKSQAFPQEKSQISTISHPIQVALFEGGDRAENFGMDIDYTPSGGSLFSVQDGAMHGMEESGSMVRAQDAAQVSFGALQRAYFSGDLLSINVSVESEVGSPMGDLYAVAWTRGSPYVFFFTGDPLSPFSLSPVPAQANIPLGSTDYLIFQSVMPSFPQGLEIYFLAALMEADAPLTADKLLSNIAQARISLIGTAEDIRDRNQWNSVRILRSLASADAFRAQIRNGVVKRLALDINIPKSLLPGYTVDDVAQALLSISENLLRVETPRIASG
jgi:hypothetical protein